MAEASTVIALNGYTRHRVLGEAVVEFSAENREAWKTAGLPRPGVDHHSGGASLHEDRKGRPHLDIVYYRYHGFADGSIREITPAAAAEIHAALDRERVPDDV